MVKKIEVSRKDLKVGTFWDIGWNWRFIYSTEGESAQGLPIDIRWEDKFEAGICQHKTMLDWIRKNEAKKRKVKYEIDDVTGNAWMTE